jgi:translation initiation factor 2 alpha subunit (eIF-2alpha)
MPRVRKPTDPIALQVRMTDGLRRKLVSAAEKNARSLNSEILWRLGQTFDEEWGRLVAGMEDQERRDQEFLDRMRQDPKMQKTLAEIIANLPDKKGR